MGRKLINEVKCSLDDDSLLLRHSASTWLYCRGIFAGLHSFWPQWPELQDVLGVYSLDQTSLWPIRVSSGPWCPTCSGCINTRHIKILSARREQVGAQVSGNTRLRQLLLATMSWLTLHGSRNEQQEHYKFRSRKHMVSGKFIQSSRSFYAHEEKLSMVFLEDIPTSANYNRSGGSNVTVATVNLHVLPLFHCKI